MPENKNFHRGTFVVFKVPNYFVGKAFIVGLIFALFYKENYQNWSFFVGKTAKVFLIEVFKMCVYVHPHAVYGYPRRGIVPVEVAGTGAQGC